MNKTDKYIIFIIKYVWGYLYLVSLLLIAIELMWNSYYHPFYTPTMWSHDYENLEYAVDFLFDVLLLIILFIGNYYLINLKENMENPPYQEINYG